MHRMAHGCGDPRPFFDDVSNDVITHQCCLLDGRMQQLYGLSALILFRLGTTLTFVLGNRR